MELDWAPILIIAEVFTLLVGGLLWIVKKQVGSMQGEFRANGGSSMKDQLNRIERDLREFRAETRLDIRDVEKEFNSHLDWHLEG